MELIETEEAVGEYYGVLGCFIVRADRGIVILDGATQGGDARVWRVKVTACGLEGSCGY